MIQFNTLELAPGGKHLIVDASITDNSYFEDITIGSLSIDTIDTFNGQYPSDKAIQCIISDDIYNQGKSLYKIVDIDGLGETIFFVWIKADGEVTEDTPCSMRSKYKLGIVYPKSGIFNTALGLLGNDICNPSKELIDFILRYNYLEAALTTGNYTKAIEIWKSLVKKPINTVSNGCACNGYR